MGREPSIKYIVFKREYFAENHAVLQFGVEEISESGSYLILYLDFHSKRTK